MTRPHDQSMLLESIVKKRNAKLIPALINSDLCKANLFLRWI